MSWGACEGVGRWGCSFHPTGVWKRSSSVAPRGPYPVPATAGRGGVVKGCGPVCMVQSWPVAGGRLCCSSFLHGPPIVLPEPSPRRPRRTLTPLFARPCTCCPLSPGHARSPVSSYLPPPPRFPPHLHHGVPPQRAGDGGRRPPGPVATKPHPRHGAPVWPVGRPEAVYAQPLFAVAPAGPPGPPSRAAAGLGGGTWWRWRWRWRRRPASWWGAPAAGTDRCLLAAGGRGGRAALAASWRAPRAAEKRGKGTRQGKRAATTAVGGCGR